jgi:hypothetical protein
VPASKTGRHGGGPDIMGGRRMFALIVALMWGVITGSGHTYSNGGQQGVYVQVDATHCVGYEWAGEVGFFGNTMGLTGGDCS